MQACGESGCVRGRESATPSRMVVGHICPAPGRELLEWQPSDGRASWPCSWQTGTADPALRLWQVPRRLPCERGSIMLGGRQTPIGSWCTADEVSRLLEEDQYTLGEGPCVDAYNLSPCRRARLTGPGTLGGRCSRRPP